jgi:hypothetical protein
MAMESGFRHGGSNNLISSAASIFASASTIAAVDEPCAKYPRGIFAVFPT